MSFYRCEFKIHGRSGGSRSAVAAAAYRSASRLSEREPPATDALAVAAYRAGQSLESEAHGAVHDFARKRGVVHSEILLPDGAPDWMADRQRLWVAVEAAERRKDAQLCREAILALPRELDREDRIELLTGFVREAFVARGMVADVNVHEVTGTGGNLAPHAHVLLTMREVTTSGFGNKRRDWNSRQLLERWRADWAGHVNEALERGGIEARVDHRSLEIRLAEALDRGDFERAAAVDRVPEPKMGPDVYAMAERGLETDRMAELLAVREENERRRELYEQVRETGPLGQAAFLELRAQTRDLAEAFLAWAELARERLERWLEAVRELARDAADRVREHAVSAFDRMVAAMSPLADVRQAEQEQADSRRVAADGLHERATGRAPLREAEAAELDALLGGLATADGTRLEAAREMVRVHERRALEREGEALERAARTAGTRAARPGDGAVSVTPQHLVDALVELAAALARLEAAQQEMAARVEAAADRAAATRVEMARALDERLAAPLAELRRQGEALGRARDALEREAARRRLVWSLEVPAWRWLLGSLGAGAVLGVAGWLGLVAPALGPASLTTPAAMAAPAAGVAPVRPQATARDRGHTPGR